MRLRLGVFATAAGWIVADHDRKEVFDTQADAIRAARRQAHLARWRGVEAEVLAQDRPGGALVPVDPPEA